MEGRGSIWVLLILQTNYRAMDEKVMPVCYQDSGSYTLASECSNPRNPSQEPARVSEKGCWLASRFATPQVAFAEARERGITSTGKMARLFKHACMYKQ